MYKGYIKHLIDLSVSTILLLICSPVFIILLCILLIANRGKPFFIQTRPGKDEKLFKIIKFRTMNNKRNMEGILLPDAQRLTKAGAFIRNYSLDEIPQLINVIKGDMSLIGPRPLLIEYLKMYDSMQKRRHEVRPGITGWAQVNGRNNITWKKKLSLDVWYVDNYNFSLDLMIIIKTIKKVIKKEDISLDWNDTPLKNPI